MNTITRTNLMIAGAETPEDLINLVALWGQEKHINNPVMQYAKLNEEAGEIAHELTRGNLTSAEMEDALGDTLVTLIILADILGYNIIDCLAKAYAVIAKRTGHTENGSFVKDEE